MNSLLVGLLVCVATHVKADFHTYKSLSTSTQCAAISCLLVYPAYCNNPGMEASQGVPGQGFCCNRCPGGANVPMKRCPQIESACQPGGSSASCGNHGDCGQCNGKMCCSTPCGPQCVTHDTVQCNGQETINLNDGCNTCDCGTNICTMQACIAEPAK